MRESERDRETGREQNEEKNKIERKKTKGTKKNLKEEKSAREKLERTKGMVPGRICVVPQAMPSESLFGLEVWQFVGSLLHYSCQHCVTLYAKCSNHKSQTASDLKLRRPNRKNFPHITVRWGQDCTIRITTFVIWASVQDAVRIVIRITNRKPNQIVRFGALRHYIHSFWLVVIHTYSHCRGRGFLMFVFV